jgi:2-polyprenyl-6-methoxyphenol hydroxylase-like FAD-dependent oxidoreductase
LDVKDSSHFPVLIVGAGPVGLGLAIELGLRDVRTLVVEQSDGTFKHPRANAINVRTMEFCRRWGVADAVRGQGMPADFPHTVLYLTSLAGFEIARIERPSHGGGTSSPFSPERPQRCNQLWFDPILRDRAASLPSVTLRNQVRFDSFEQTDDGIAAKIRDLKTDNVEQIAARYLVACCGGQSSIRDTLGIEMEGLPVQGYPIDIFLRAPDLWTKHDKGKAALHYLIGPQGVWGSLIPLNGDDFWRLTIHGSTTYQDPDKFDAHACVKKAFGGDFAYEVISVIDWTRRELVATRFSDGPVFIAGDCAHVNSPSGGYGMNTGMGDAVDLGWKLAATLEGWGGSKLLDSYDAERRPVSVRNVNEATRNLETRTFPISEAVASDTAEGEAIRAELLQKFQSESKRRFNSFGIALGYCYAASPICIADEDAAQPQDVATFSPTSHPGCLAPHGWLPDGRSTKDLFGRRFVLLKFGEGAPNTDAVVDAATLRGMPFEEIDIPDSELCALYQRRLVLVRPDGHVAWRSDEIPTDALSVIDRVRGASSVA